MSATYYNIKRATRTCPECQGTGRDKFGSIGVTFFRFTTANQIQRTRAFTSSFNINCPTCGGSGIQEYWKPVELTDVLYQRLKG